MAPYIAARFEKAGARVSRQEFSIRGVGFENVIGRFGPADGQPLIVGAHYDAFGGFGDNPGADDNASGTAGLMELARLLDGADLLRPVELVAFSTEEPRGDFIGVAGRWQDRRLARAVKRAFRGAGEVPVYSFNGPLNPGLDTPPRNGVLSPSQRANG